MKISLLKLTGLFAIALFLEEMVQAQSSDHIREDVRISISPDEFRNANGFTIKNINGDVSVSGYVGDEIVIEGTKEVWKKKGEISEEESQEVRFTTRFYEGVMYAYLEAPGVHAEFFEGRMDYHWHNDNREERNRLRYNLNVEVKVPNHLRLTASTVNGGEVLVANMMNGVKASNVNGSVKLKDVKGDTDVNSVNGDIEVWFLESPTSNSDFKTVNGTIEIYSPKDLSAIVTFESLHGELYTDFEQVKRLPNRLNKEQDGDGYRYRIDQNSPIQIGGGEYEMTFKMVNGSVYIRERKS